MKELKRLNFIPENGLPSFSSTVEVVEKLKKEHNVDEIYLDIMTWKEIDFSRFDPENVTATPYKEHFQLVLMAKE